MNDLHHHCCTHDDERGSSLRRIVRFPFFIFTVLTIHSYDYEYIQQPHQPHQRHLTMKRTRDPYRDPGMYFFFFFNTVLTFIYGYVYVQHHPPWCVTTSPSASTSSFYYDGLINDFICDAFHEVSFFGASLGLTITYLLYDNYDSSTTTTTAAAYPNHLWICNALECTPMLLTARSAVVTVVCDDASMFYLRVFSVPVKYCLWLLFRWMRVRWCNIVDDRCFVQHLDYCVICCIILTGAKNK